MKHEEMHVWGLVAAHRHLPPLPPGKVCHYLDLRHRDGGVIRDGSQEREVSLLTDVFNKPIDQRQA